MNGWWYDPECGGTNPTGIVYVGPNNAGTAMIDEHIVYRGHCFVRVVPR